MSFSLFPLLASLLALPAVSLAADSSLDATISKIPEWNANLTWSTCPEAPDDPALSCTEFVIPLDWHDESVGLGKLGVVYYSVDPSQRVGSIFVNPGGPGGSGREFVLGSATTLATLSNGMYDIVGWDPRGVGNITVPGESACFETEGDYAEFFNGTVVYPVFDYRGNFTDKTEIDEFYALVEPTEERFKKLKEQCDTKGTGAYMPYVGTVATIRDIVAMNDFFEGTYSDKSGESDINFWGFSYGTLIGSTLVNMFPDRVGRVIIDGVVDPVGYWVDRTDLSWAGGVEATDEAFQAFANGCTLAGPEACFIADQRVRGNLDIIGWAQNLSDWAHDEADVGYLLRNSLFQAMYSPQAWGQYANGDLLSLWKAVASGEVAQAYKDKINVPVDFDSFTAPHTDAQTAIEAGDARDPEAGLTLRQVFDELLRVSHEVSGFFGGSSLQSRHAALVWPYRAVERYNGPFNSTLKNKILVVTTEADPITPAPNAKKVADLLGDSAEYIEQKGAGHTTLAERSSCMGKIFQQYFLDGSSPSGDDTICAVDDSTALFPPVTSGSGDTTDEDEIEKESGLDDISTFSSVDDKEEKEGGDSEHKAESSEEETELEELQKANKTLRMALITVGAVLGVALLALASLIVYARKKNQRYAPIGNDQQPILATNVPVWDAQMSHDAPYDPYTGASRGSLVDEKPRYGDPYTDKDPAPRQSLLNSDPYDSSRSHR